MAGFACCPHCPNDAHPLPGEVVDHPFPCPIPECGQTPPSDVISVGQAAMGRVREQPLPVVNAGPCIQDLVREDIAARLQLGIERYGTGLQANNGRDMLLDAYEESLDLATYLRGVLYERDGR